MSGEQGLINPYPDPTSSRAYALIFSGLSAALNEDQWMPLSELARVSQAIYESLRGGDLEVRFADGLEMLRLADIELTEWCSRSMSGEQWTAETEVMAAKAIWNETYNYSPSLLWRWETGSEDDHRRAREVARAVLSTLADAGLLMPAGRRCVHDRWTCDHCHDDPPPGHTCPSCGAAATTGGRP